MFECLTYFFCFKGISNIGNPMMIFSQEKGRVFFYHGSCRRSRKNLKGEGLEFTSLQESGDNGLVFFRNLGI